MNIGPLELTIICTISLFLLLLQVGIALVIWRAIRRPDLNKGSDARGRIPCPYCAELILPEAKICRYCGRDLEAKSSS